MKTNRVIYRLATIAVVSFFFVCCVRHAAEAQDAIPEVVVSGLDNPRGVAVQPGTGTVFVAESGAGRVVRVVDGKIEPVIVDFPTEVYDKAPIYKIGPLGLLFLDAETLVVGGGGLTSGADSVRVFKIPGAGEPAINASQVHGRARSLVDGAENRELGNYYGLALGTKGVYATSGGDDLNGWICLGTLNSKSQLSKFERLFETRQATFTKAPLAITISPQGYLALAQMGETTAVTDSQLTFFSEAGENLGIFQTGLRDITGLSYGPRHGRLFAIDFNWSDPAGGGLFKLVGIKSETKCKAVRMSDLKGPTAMTFNNSGDCFVTLAGNPQLSAIPDGKLIIFRQLDVDPNQ